MNKVQLSFGCMVLMILGALSMAHSQVSNIDTVYTPMGYPDLALSARVFLPDPLNARGVGVVLCRGSGTGKLTGLRIWCDTLAARGYVAMTIDYYDLNVSPWGLYPRSVRAFKTAVEFLRQNKDRFGITTGKIVGLGQSQGSIVWGQTITWDNADGFFGTDPAVDDHLDAAVLLYGAYDTFNNLTTVLYDWFTVHFSPDPALRTTTGQPRANAMNVTTPVLLIHGTSDNVVNVYHSRVFRDSLTYYGRPVKYVEFPGRGHGFDINGSTLRFSADGLVVKDTVLAFLDEVLLGLSVKKAPESLPRGFALDHNYPNPFNPTTTIRFSLHTSLFTTLTIYSILGQPVATLANERLGPGTYSVTWDANGFPSGVYLYRLQAGELVQTKRLLLLR